MQRVLKFYRDGLGYETDYKDGDPPICFFNTPGTKFELYPPLFLACRREIPAKTIHPEAADLAASRWLIT